jgi:NhaA family Na+:H+ antiporter
MISSVPRRVFRTVNRFLRVEAASSVVLLSAALGALIWANSPGAALYEALWHAPLSVGIGPWSASPSLHAWVNEGLMSVFFFVVGLEIRREMHEGVLASRRAATLPLVAAAAGVLVPAMIYLGIGSDEASRPGWAVPTATDIAFAVGVLALLGRSIPRAARVFLLAIAIVDDVVAVTVIAIFYSGGLDHGGLTLAGIVLGLLTPTLSRRGAVRLESLLHPWVAFGIMPLFAFANAGVALGGVDFGDAGVVKVTVATAAALVIGKPLGILLGSWLAVRSGWCRLPHGLSWSGVAIVGCLGGIGFTMSIFIATLAFADPVLLTAAKLGVLVASFAAGTIGLMLGIVLARGRPALAKRK